MASSTEPAWLRNPPSTISRERRPRNPKPSPSLPHTSFNTGPSVVDLDRSGSGSGGEDGRDNLSPEVIDLTADVSPQLDLNQTRTSQSELDLNQPSPLQIRTSQSVLDLDQTRPGSVLQQSSRESLELDSLNGNFNLELDDSEEVLMDPDAEEEEQKTQANSEEELETEEEEQQLLSQLQTTGTFDVLRSLSESQHHTASGLDQSTNESIVTRRRRRAVIYDSEEDEEEEQPKAPPLKDLFQVLGASTPKSASSPQRRRKSVGNVTMASQRSLLLSIINDLDLQEDKSSDEGGSDEEEEAVDKSTEDMEEEEDAQCHSELKQKDTEEELNAEEEEAVDQSTEDMEDDEDQISSTHEEEEENMSFNLEASSGEPELGSGEKMDPCAAESSSETETFQSLVLRGKESYSQTRLDEALSLFLRAIDMKPGDPEVQFLVIQLYRQLFQRQ